MCLVCIFLFRNKKDLKNLNVDNPLIYVYVIESVKSSVYIFYISIINTLLSHFINNNILAFSGNNMRKDVFGLSILTIMAQIACDRAI